jgi:hypothetical protein
VRGDASRDIGCRRVSWRGGGYTLQCTANEKPTHEHTLGAGCNKQIPRYHPNCLALPPPPRRARRVGAEATLCEHRTERPAGVSHAWAGMRSMPCPQITGGLPAGATGHVAGEPDGFCRMHGVGPASRSGGLQCAEPEGGFHVARDAGLTLSPVRCDPRRVYSSLATSLFAMCQVYAGRGGDVKGGSDAV